MSSTDKTKGSPSPAGDDQVRKINFYLYGAAFIANMISLACGITFSWTSPMLLKLNGKRDPHMNPLTHAVTPMQECWIVNSMGLGAIIGPFAVGKLADTIGRKTTSLIAAVPLLGAFFLLAFATQVFYIYIARFMCGLSLGATFVLLPIFLGEIAEDSNRGEFGCLMSVFLTLGVLLSYVAGPYLSVKMFSLSCTLPVWIFLIFFGVFVPESPVYYIYKGNKEEAEKSLAKLRNKSQKSLQKELMEMEEYVEKVKADGMTFKDMIKSKCLSKGLTISVGLVLCQQFSGISIVLAFMEPILDSTGSDIPSDISVIIIGIIQVLAAIVASSLVERAGRKILLLVSCVGSGLSLITLGIYFYLKDHDLRVGSIFWLPMASLIVYIISFNIGLGPLPWAIVGEIFPANVKSIASMLTSSIVFLGAFSITIFFSYLAQYLGMAVTFWMFAMCCGFAFIFIYFVMIETKGRSLTEIQDILNGKEK